MDAIFLTLSPGIPVAIPRRLRLELAPGTGALRLDVGAASSDWRASVEAAWRAALAITARADVDGTLRVPVGPALEGGSAGLPFGILALGALLDRALPRHFATGTVTTLLGDVYGGVATVPKAEAAARIARQEGASAVFFAPPMRPPTVAGARIEPVTDIAVAYARLDPDGYRGIAQRHAEMRAATDERARAHVTIPGAQPRSHVVDGIEIVAADGERPWLRLIDDRRLLWQRPLDDRDDAWVAEQHALARFAARVRDA